MPKVLMPIGDATEILDTLYPFYRLPEDGFEAVIAGKDEEIRVLQTRVYRESEDKVGWKRSADYWKAEALKLGYADKDSIDIATGEFVNG